MGKRYLLLGLIVGIITFVVGIGSAFLFPNLSFGSFFNPGTIGGLIGGLVGGVLAERWRRSSQK